MMGAQGILSMYQQMGDTKGDIKEQLDTASSAYKKLSKMCQPSIERDKAIAEVFGLVNTAESVIGMFGKFL
jgi:hypothetical protein